MPNTVRKGRCPCSLAAFELCPLLTAGSFDIYLLLRKGPLLHTQVFFKVLMGYRPPIPPDMPQVYKDLMTACWDEDPANRPPFQDIERYMRAMYYNSGRARRATRAAASSSTPGGERRAARWTGPVFPRVTHRDSPAHCT